MSTVVNPDTNEHEAAAPDRAREPAAPETLSCPKCGAPADRGQLICLECGSRLALGYRRPPAWRLPAAVVGIVLLVAGFAVAIALAANHADRTTAAAPTAPAPAQTAPADTPPTATPPTATQPTPAPSTSTTTPAPAPASTPGGGTNPSGTSTTPTPAPTTASGWPPGKSAFTVILASMPSKSAADDKLQKAQAAGISGAAILRSDDFPTLKPGYWVVFDGQYDSIGQAQSQAATDRGKGEFSDAYPRFVSKDANAKP
jgi:eukaryotic-like serine/threonine-protein kinase